MEDISDIRSLSLSSLNINTRRLLSNLLDSTKVLTTEGPLKRHRWIHWCDTDFWQPVGFVPTYIEWSFPVVPTYRKYLLYTQIVLWITKFDLIVLRNTVCFTQTAISEINCWLIYIYFLLKSHLHLYILCYTYITYSFRDWRGLASLVNISSELESTIWHYNDKTGKVLELWMQSRAGTVGELLEHLIALDRFDVYDDIIDSIREHNQRPG